jgi:hypothetical protein
LNFEADSGIFSELAVAFPKTVPHAGGLAFNGPQILFGSEQRYPPFLDAELLGSAARKSKWIHWPPYSSICH